MAQLRQIGMSITPNYAPKKTVGEGLANLLIASADATIKYNAINEQEKNKLEREQLEEDANTQNFIKAKMNKAYTDGKFKTYKEAEDYLNNGIMQDEDYVSRYGSKKTNELFKHKSSIDSWRYSSSKMVKELGKSQEVIADQERRRQEGDDAIIYNDYVKNRETRFTNADFKNMSNSQKKEFMSKEIELINSDAMLQSFGSDMFKNKASSILNKAKQDYMDLGYAADKEIVDKTSSEIINNYVNSSDKMSIEALDSAVESLNELLPASQQIENQKMYLELSNAVVNELRNNEQKYIGKTKSDLMKEFPVLAKVNDYKNKSIINNTLKTIDDKTKIVNTSNDVLTGKERLQLQDKDVKDQVKKALSLNTKKALENRDEGALKQVIAFSTKNNLKIDFVESEASAFLDMISGEQATSLPAEAFSRYGLLRGMQSGKYTIRNKKSADAMDELKTIASISNYDLTTEDGFKSAVLKRNMLIEKEKIVGSITKKEREELFGLAKELKEDEGWFGFGKSKINDSGLNVVTEMARQNILFGMEKEDAVEKAFDDYKEKFAETNGVDYRDIGIYTEKDLSLLRQEIKKEKELNVNTIEIFGESAIVTFESPSSEKHSQQMYSIKDLATKFKRAKSGDSLKAKEEEKAKVEQELEDKVLSDNLITQGLDKDIITSIKSGVAEFYTDKSDIIGSLESEGNGRDFITEIKDGFKEWSNRVNKTEFKLSNDEDYTKPDTKIDNVLDTIINILSPTSLRADNNFIKQDGSIASMQDAAKKDIGKLTLEDIRNSLNGKPNKEIKQQNIEQFSLKNSSKDRKAFVNSNKGNFSSKEERAAFMAQVYQESKGVPQQENLNYSEKTITKVFSKSRLQGKNPKDLARNPKELANTVYGGIWGKKNLGNIQPNDGWNFRGRGLIQITGRANYQYFGKLLNIDLVNNPDMANNPEVAFKIAEAYWDKRVRTKVKNFSDVKSVTKAVNGGTHGLEQRKKYFNIYMK